MARQSRLRTAFSMRWAVAIAIALLATQAPAAEEPPPTIPEGTHKQVKVLTPTFGDASLKLTAFCLDKEGNVITLVNHVAPPANVNQATPAARLQLRLTPRAIQKKPNDKKPEAPKPADDSKNTSAEDKTSATQPKVKLSATRALLRAIAPAVTEPTADNSADSTPACETASEQETAAAEAGSDEAPAALAGRAEVRILTADGKLLRKWPIDFEAQAINVDPDGNIVVAGDGFIARYDAEGKQLAKADSPQVAKLAKNQQELEDQARETLLSQAASLEENLKNLERQKATLDEKKDEDLSDAEKTQKKQLDLIVQTYKRSLESYKSPNEARIKMLTQQLAGRGRKINAIAASDKYLFVTCGDPKGFGYSVWRTEKNFSNPKQIVSGLSGCCGQMDVQCCGDELVVAENSRKRVVRYDADGKKVASFGKASRDGAGDTFGSCCNPMNTRLHGGKLLVSDSDGRVRLFALDGTYENEVGKADVRPGCKSSTVDISPDGNRVYYIDVNTSRICVLDRKPADDKQASVQ